MKSWTKLLHWALPAAALLAGQSAQAQTLVNAVGPDLKPAYVSGTTQPGVANTGTDIIRLPSGERLQAMVWDNGNKKVTLSWSRFTGATLPVLIAGAAIDVFVPNTTFTYSDPDVALSFNQSGVLFANVVYLANDGTGNQTWRNIYQYNPGTQAFTLVLNANSPRALGVKTIPNVLGFSPATITRIHTAPNIDANASGAVGIVWQESSVETAQVTTVSASYPPPGKVDILQNLVFAESFMTGATIDGPVHCSNRGLAVTTLLGTTGGPVLYTQSLSPDVAITSDGKLWVCYLNSTAIQGTPPISTGLNLVVKQVAFDLCSVTQTIATQAWGGVSLAPPRIAAPANANTSDVQVVQAGNGGGSCFTGSNSFIYNYGISDGKRQDVAVVNTGYTLNTAGEPVVTYLGGDTFTNGNNQYVVSWTGQNYQELTGNGTDVWARLMAGGFPVTSPGSFSRVNTYTAGSQALPSIAARYCGDKNATAHLFFNTATSDLGYKFTPTAIGGALARPAAPATGSVAAPAAAEARALVAYPNPSTSAVELRLTLRPAETVQRLQLTDLSGRVLETLPLPTVEAAAAGEENKDTPPPYIQLHTQPVADRGQLLAEADDQSAQRNAGAGPQIRPQRPVCTCWF